jgi:hypothetical protein
VTAAPGDVDNRQQRQPVDQAVANLSTGGQPIDAGSATDQLRRQLRAPRAKAVSVRAQVVANAGTDLAIAPSSPAAPCPPSRAGQYRVAGRHRRRCRPLAVRFRRLLAQPEELEGQEAEESPRRWDGLRSVTDKRSTPEADQPGPEMATIAAGRQAAS